MFDISLKELTEAGYVLKSLAQQNKAEIEKLEDIRASLRGNSGMEGVISMLGKQVEELVSCQQSLTNLWHALICICDMYSKTDIRVSDYCDGNIRKINYPQIQDVQIEPIDSSYIIF